MYGPSYRTDPQLAAQNNGRSWLDCNLRSRPRPHRWEPDVQTSPAGTLEDTATYWQCARCPVSTRTYGHANTPAPYLGGRNR